MAKEVIKIEGLLSTLATITALPKQVTKAHRQAMNAAATPVLREVRKNTPKRTGMLKKAEKKKVKTYPSKNAIALIGPDKNVIGTDEKGNKVWPVKYWHLVLRNHDILGDALKKTGATAIEIASQKYIEAIKKIKGGGKR